MSEASAPRLDRLLQDSSGRAPDGLGPIEEALARAPDPDRAVHLAAVALGAPLADGRRVVDVLVTATGRADAERIGRILFAICGVAPFLAPHFRRHPDWLPRLVEDDLSRPLDPEATRRELAQALTGDGDPVATLRAHKYLEFARITIRDADPAFVPPHEVATTLGDLSALADALLDAALAVARQRIAEQFGPARWRTVSGDLVELSFVVLGLGKLGAEELNYSSDVDLVYVHASPKQPLAPARPGDDATARLDPADYFTRLAQAFGRLVTPVTADGFLYRIDLELRPEGAQGAMVTSEDALETYYEAWADTWERAAFMKARPVAGDLSLGWRVVRDIAPIIFQSTMDFAAVESIRDLKRKVEEAHGRSTAGFNVKLDAGGIRDVEFVAQALQLLHGGRIPQVRERSTQRALMGLARVDLLREEDAEQLTDAYRLLRRTENRLQMEDEKQIHVVPAAPVARLRLARAMGFTGDDALEGFDRALAAARESVRAILDRIFASDARDRIHELVLRHATSIALQPGMSQLIDDLAGRLARSIEAVPDPERALNNLDRFLEGVGSRRFYYSLLLDRPEIIDRLTAMFSASRFLSSTLASHPRLIEPVFADPNVLLLTREQLVADLQKTEEALGGETEQRLDALRIFQHRQVLNVGLLDLAGQIDRAEVETALTEIAEVCLDAALGLAQGLLAASRDGVPDAAGRGSFLIVGMGKLGSREIGYGSDLDLIFLYDLLPEDRAASAFAQHHFVKLTQRLISILQTATAEGSCYEIDARLRPSGNQGTLVTSFDAFTRYHDTSAELWERQALLRARPVAGSTALADRFEAQRRAILVQPVPARAIEEVDAIRRRMEDELGREAPGRRNFKTGRGGLLDVETIVQVIVLENAHAHPELLEPERLERQLDRIEALGLLDADDAAILRRGWAFLQGLASRLRIVENRSISDLDDERGDLESLARHVGYPAGPREGDARRALLRDYARHTEAIRAVYERFVQTASTA